MIAITRFSCANSIHNASQKHPHSLFVIDFGERVPILIIHSLRKHLLNSWLSIKHVHAN